MDKEFLNLHSLMQHRAIMAITLPNALLMDTNILTPSNLQCGSVRILVGLF